MLKTDKVFAGSVPANYDRYMVPLIFEPFAADLARRAAALSPDAVLETAAGSGVVTRALAPTLRVAQYRQRTVRKSTAPYSDRSFPESSRRTPCQFPTLRSPAARLMARGQHISF